MSTEQTPGFGNFKPWDDFDPYIQEANTSYQELKDLHQKYLDQFLKMDGPEAIIFYCQYVCPSQMDVNGALINEVSTVSSDFANISDFINMLKYEFNSAKPTEKVPNPTDRTSDFINQINGLINAIKGDELLDGKNKDEIIGPLKTLRDIFTGQTMTDVWKKADDKTNPDGSQLKKVLNQFDVLSTVTTTISQNTESKMKYEVNDFNVLMNFDKDAIKTQSKSTTQFINRFKQQ
jgi:hypothetical protein